MGQYLAADNAATLLAASVTNSPSVTSLILQDASKFPVVNHGGAGSDWSYVTLYDSANNIETVKLTRRDSGSNTLTIVRGTAAGISGVTDANCLAWAATTTGVACRLVSQVVNDITAQIGAAAASASSAAASAASAASSSASAVTTAANAQTAASNAQTTANGAQTTANGVQTSLSNLISGAAGFVKAKLGQAANTAYNFLFDASDANGTMKLTRESGQDILTVAADGKISFPQGVGAVSGLPAFQCRAWVNFNGSGVVSILGGGNVASVTDNGVGDYTVNFATPMPDANYACTGSAQGNSVAGGTYVVGVNSLTASSVRVSVCRNDENSTIPTDVSIVSVLIFR